MPPSEITQEWAAWDWREDVRRWFNKHYRSFNSVTEDVVSFFELAFAKTQCPDHAWFGVHKTRISLVIGSLWVAALMDSSDDGRGIWLALDQNPPAINGLGYKMIVATRKSEFPLNWGHSESLSVIPDLVRNDSLWESFSSATEKMRYCAYGKDKDSFQKRHNKKRLSQFWLTTEPEHRFPDEIEGEARVVEGARYQVTVNAYERDSGARRRCIRHHGTSCSICGFSFGAHYGEVAEGFIHVHHLKPLSEIGAEYVLDPVNDLIPVCPNCHAVFHLRKPAFSIEETKDLLRKKGASPPDSGRQEGFGSDRTGKKIN